MNRLVQHPAAAPATTLTALMRDFLLSLAPGPRSYMEVMEGWRTSCPRLTVWEDALGDGLIRVERGAGPGMDGQQVVLTERGRALISVL